MSARFNADSGRYEYCGASSERLRDDGAMDALKERERCDWCGAADPERVRVVVHGPDLHFCNAECEREYYTNDEYR
jgi:hypothetical protein